MTSIDAPAMLRLVVEFARSLTKVPAVAPMNGVAHQLLERAEARAGRDPRAAQELRSAASAYLSVVR
jgi:hypothetical protein